MSSLQDERIIGTIEIACKSDRTVREGVGTHAARVHEWAREVWEAYSAQQELARSWIKRAMGERTDL